MLAKINENMAKFLNRSGHSKNLNHYSETPTVLMEQIWLVDLECVLIHASKRTLTQALINPLKNAFYLQGGGCRHRRL